jgi:hypothetical protein
MGGEMASSVSQVISGRGNEDCGFNSKYSPSSMQGSQQGHHSLKSIHLEVCEF